MLLLLLYVVCFMYTYVVLFSRKARVASDQNIINLGLQGSSNFNYSYFYLGFLPSTAPRPVLKEYTGDTLPIRLPAWHYVWMCLLSIYMSPFSMHVSVSLC